MSRFKQALLVSIIVLGFFLPLSFILAASLAAVPGVGTYNVGQNFTVRINVSSPGEALNAIAGNLTFPIDKLEVVSISKASSILSYWITEPSFSNSEGSVKFEGVVPNPGFTGLAGQVVNITFRGKKAGEATLDFATGSVLANDGQGTEILERMIGGQYSLKLISTTPPATVSTTPGSDYAPPAPEVTSSTHPDSNKWYNNNNPTFAWKLSSDIDGANILADKKANSNPGTKSDGPISSYQYKDVSDGEWYFHLRVHNENGWGGIAHFGFNVDTVKPDQFEVSLIPRSDPTDPRLGVVVAAHDATSGIDYYEFSVDNGSPVVWRDDGKHLYLFDVKTPGEHHLLAKVFDRAGNYLANSIDFTVIPIDPPEITEYPLELVYGDVLKVGGSTYPISRVYLNVVSGTGEKLEYQTSSDNQGNFNLVVDRKLKEGIYKISAYVVDGRGAMSNWSEAITVPVKLSPFWKFGLLATNTLALIIPLLALLLLILFLIWYTWHKMTALRKRLRKETREAEDALHQAFDLLRTDLAEGVERLETASDKRELTKDEKSLLRQFRKSLDEAEKFVRKEIVDIEKEVD